MEMTMDTGLRHLKHLVAAVQYGSLRRAAQALHLRQSTLSRAIKQFEDELGVTLFVRSTGGVRLTPAGNHFFETAKRVLADFEALVSTARALGRGSEGRLVFGLPASYVCSMVRGVLRDYATEFPDVTIQLVEKSKIALLCDLDMGALDVALVAGGTPQKGYESLTLWSERIMVAVPEQHRLAKEPFVHWNDLIDEAVLASRLGFGPELAKRMVARAGGRSTPQVEGHPVDGDALLSLVAAGRGLLLQSAGALRAEQPGLVYLEVHEEVGASWITFSACWKNDRSNPALTAFIALLKAHCSLLPASRASDV
jgi:DNA-binding transcriptional LysR family regulator